MFVQQVLEAGQVAGLGRDDPGVHHDRLDDHPGDLARVLVEEAGHAVQVVERGDQGQVDDGPGDAGGRGDLRGLVGRADVFRHGQDGYLDRVVMAVVAALDLDDQVP